MADRLHKSLLNARINLLFYFLGLFFAFYSRRIFLQCLGEEFIGLTGTLTNILNYLNLAEFGMSSAISYFLYKPLEQDNREEVCRVLSVFGYMYRLVGTFILVAGILVSLFFPLIFGNTELSMGIVYFAFASILGSQLIGYFINYREILLVADQKQYLVSVYYQSAGLVKIALQIFLAYTYRNLYIWVAIEMVFAVIACVVLNWKINKEYPWLKTDKSRGREYLHDYPDITKKTGQIFIHHIKYFLLTKSDELFVFIIASLKYVAYYGNYTMLITKVTLLFNMVLNSVNAGVGNLVAEGNRDKEVSVFWELMALRQFVAGLICFGVYHLTESFIAVWLGPEFVLPHHMLLLFVIYAFMTVTRPVVEIFLHAHGLYDDVWSAWTELILNVGITFGIGLPFGIVGILLGKIVSVGLIIMLWKPYYLYQRGFNQGVSAYWNGTLRHYVVIAIAAITATWLTSLIPLHNSTNFLWWVLSAAVTLGIYIVIAAPLTYYFTPGARDCTVRLLSRFLHK